MQYTLDSVVHAVSTLEKEFKRKVMSYEVGLKNLNQLHKNNHSQNVYYFGVLTFGDKAMKGDNIIELDTLELLHSPNLPPLISQQSNSQIVELFNSVNPTYEDRAVDTHLDYIAGRFRGFQLVVTNESLK